MMSPAQGRRQRKQLMRSGDLAFVGGGEENTASGTGAAVAGGFINTASGDFSSAAEG